jgi:hypothetical protein
MRSFMVCNLHYILFRLPNKKKMGQACSTYKEEER